MKRQQNILFTPFSIKGRSVKNRICLPPMVRFARKRTDGFSEPEDVAYYRTYAKGGFGLVIVEAACILPGGELAPCELGVYDDAFIEGLSAIAAAIKEEGSLAVLQLHHAGIVGIGEDNISASAAVIESRGIATKPARSHEATPEEIEAIISGFAEGARRAEAAGFDGVEIHGCHNYLLSQFMSRNLNRRTDRYGKTDQLALDVIERIKGKVTDDFIVGIRLGGFEPTLADGLRHAKAVEAAGVDYISVSYGFYIIHAPEKPEGYPLRDIFYAAQEIKKSVSVPVMAVRCITSPEQAEDILEKTGVDGVLIGRGGLINPNWANDAAAGKPTGRCFDCPGCYFRNFRENCPGLDELKKLTAR